MNVYLILLLIFLPFIIFLCGILIAKIRFLDVFFPILFMILALLPITVLQYFMAPLFSNENVKKYGLLILLFGALIDFGFLEEGFKSLALFLVPSKNMKFSIFFIASMLAGLFLGCCESTIYFLNGIKSMASNTPSKSIEILPSVFLRMGTADIIHMFCAGIASVSVWAAKNKKIVILPLMMAILLHALYDYFILVQLIGFYSVVVILFAILQCRLSFIRGKEIEDIINKDSLVSLNSV